MIKKKFTVVLLVYFIVILSLIGFTFWQENSTTKTLKPALPAGGHSKFNNLNTSSPLATFFPPKLTLESIFVSDHSWVNQLPPDKTITLITTGDVIPARTVNYKMTVLNNFTYPFEKTADFLKTADLTLINLESPLIKDCPITNEGMVFCGGQRFIEGLQFADIDVVNLANNHSLNYGIDGLNQTINLLTNNNMAVSGYSNNNFRPKDDQLLAGAIKQFNNFRIGFLGWNLLDNFNEVKIISEIKKAKQKVDLLIVSLHWGAEYQAMPADWQVKLSQSLIDAGADLIVGNHPHWVQPIQVYKDKLIIYAHGNFIFDQEWSSETKTGVVGRHTFYDGKLVDSQFFPVFISNYSQPEFLLGEKKDKVIKLLKERSQQLN